MLSHKFPIKDCIYCYDGSFEGFLCCVFESFLKKETPISIWQPATETTSFYPLVQIDTDTTRADRVFRSLSTKLSPHAQTMVMTCFFSGDPEKEYALLRFLQFAFTVGEKALHMLGHEAVAPIYAMEKQIHHEAHQFKGFLRFEESEGMLGAVIAPKNYILPLLRPHFCSRFPEENFLIYDETHLAALVYRNHSAEILQLTTPLTLPVQSKKESYYQTLWKQFYKTIEIKERHNELCRRTLCPKRYWANMTELKAEC